eukprot:IDg14133t1
MTPHLQQRQTRLVLLTYEAVFLMKQALRFRLGCLGTIANPRASAVRNWWQFLVGRTDSEAPLARTKSRRN